MTPAYRKITAIVRVDQLSRVEHALQELRVSGVSVSPVRGYGEYTDFFARDWMSPYVRVEIFTSAEHVERIADAMTAAASTGTRGDGIVAIEEVAAVIRTRNRSPVPPSEI